jgi:hypothetical protein
MENDKLGDDLLFLLKQQRTLYHQLKVLAAQQKEVFWQSNSPEELVRVLSGRRKLIEKLREVNSKLKSIKTNWPMIRDRMNFKERLEAHVLAGSVAQIVSELKGMDAFKSQPMDILSDTAQLAEHFVDQKTKDSL